MCGWACRRWPSATGPLHMHGTIPTQPLQNRGRVRVCHSCQSPPTAQPAPHYGGPIWALKPDGYYQALRVLQGCWTEHC